MSSNKIELNFIEPEPYSEDEDYVNRYGIQGFPIDQEGSKVYFGLIASNTTDDIETVPFFDPSKAGSLEKQLTDIIYKLNRSKTHDWFSLGLIPPSNDAKQSVRAR